MKALLMYPNRDFDLQQPLPAHEPTLSKDLELDTLLGVMADKDEFVFKVSQRVLLTGMQNDLETIVYRQEIVRDSLRNPQIIRRLYALSIEAIEEKKKNYFGYFGNYPSSILHGAVQVLRIFMETLKKIRALTEEVPDGFASRGLHAMFTMIQSEFSDEYFASIQSHLVQLRFNDGVLLSARLGKENQGKDYVLHPSLGRKWDWLKRVLGRGSPAYTIHIFPRDDAGAKALAALRDQGIALVADALNQSMDHILGFFEMLRTELAFYIGCINLNERLGQLNATTTFPTPEPVGSGSNHFSELYDVCLALNMGKRIVGNEVDADGKQLVIITGANQGGKSSFLRSVGLSQLMMQCGMFVAAQSFTAELCRGIFTHYRREEDSTMMSGKLDEEMARMSEIADLITPHSMILFNESFASTNEREGSQIAREIMDALIERDIKIFCVTHLYELSHPLFVQKEKKAMFLRAERAADGTRSFQLREGEPLETSYGEDLYHAIFSGEQNPS